jgi:hypothetical protein
MWEDVLETSAARRASMSLLDENQCKVQVLIDPSGVRRTSCRGLYLNSKEVLLIVPLSGMIDEGDGDLIEQSE